MQQPFWGPDCTPGTPHPLPGMCSQLPACALLRGRRSSLTCQGKNGQPLTGAVSASGFWLNKAACGHKWGLVFFSFWKGKGGDTKAGMAAHNKADCCNSHCSLASPRSPSQWSSILSHPKSLSFEWCWSNYPWKWLWGKGVLPLQHFVLSWRNGLCKIEQTSLTGLQPVSILKLSPKTERIGTFPLMRAANIVLSQV